MAAKKSGKPKLKKLVSEAFQGADGMHIVLVKPSVPKVSKATYTRRKKAASKKS